MPDAVCEGRSGRARNVVWRDGFTESSAVVWRSAARHWRRWRCRRTACGPMVCRGRLPCRRRERVSLHRRRGYPRPHRWFRRLHPGHRPVWGQPSPRRPGSRAARQLRRARLYRPQRRRSRPARSRPAGRQRTLSPRSRIHPARYRASFPPCNRPRAPPALRSWAPRPELHRPSDTPSRAWFPGSHSRPFRQSIRLPGWSRRSQGQLNRWRRSRSRPSTLRRPRRGVRGFRPVSRPAMRTPGSAWVLDP